LTEEHGITIMVTQNSTSKRQHPEFSLNRIKELATKGKVNYGSRDVHRDVVNLSYSFTDVCNCLCELDESNYIESICYEKYSGWFDVYHSAWQLAEQPSDPLYLKLKLDRDCTTIVLASFHREGSL
jgi:hypothetical protein